MYDHLCSDKKKLEYKKEYYLPKAIKEFRKACQFPCWKWYEYKIPSSNNKYIIFYYAENPNCIDNPKVDLFADVFFERQRFVVKWGGGGYKHTENSPIKLIRQIHAYTSHFLHRYNERVLKDNTLSSNDVACRYFSRNTFEMPIEIDEDINKHIEEYGEHARQGFLVQDGVCFTQAGLEGNFHGNERQDNDRVDAMLVVYTTFVSKYQITNDQNLAVLKKSWERWNQSYLALMKEAKDGIVTLTLEP